MATKRVVTPDNLSNSYFDIGENTSNQIEFKFAFSVSRLKTSTNLPPVVFITDNTKEGLFEYDNTDTTTVGDDIDVIVTNAGRRYKRKTSTTTEVLNKLDKGYTIAQLRTLTDSKVNTIGLFYCIDNGKEGWWKYDSTDTTSTDNLGTILVTSTGKRLKRIIEDYIYPEWFGAKGDGIIDDTTFLQNTLDYSSNYPVILSNSYLISNTININYNNTKIIGLKNNLISGDIYWGFTIKNVNNTFIDGVNIKSTKIADYSSTSESGAPQGIANGGLIFHYTSNGYVVENITIKNCSFSSPYGSINAIKLAGNRNNIGGYLNNVLIENCRFTDVGRIAIEILGSSILNRFDYSNIKITNCYFKNIGIKSVYGMAVSFSGNGNYNSVSNCYINNAKDIALENAGASYTKFINNTFENLDSGCVLFTIQSNDDGVIKKGNCAVNNQVLDKSANRIGDIYYQDNLIMSNNTLSTYNAGLVLNVVSNSYFNNNKLYTDGNIVLGSYGSTLYFREGVSFNNIFISNTILNNSTGYDCVYVSEACYNNFFNYNYLKFQQTTSKKLFNDRTNGLNYLNSIINDNSFSNYSDLYSDYSSLLKIGNTKFFIDSDNELLYKNSGIGNPTSQTDGRRFITSGEQYKTAQIDGLYCFTDGNVSIGSATNSGYKLNVSGNSRFFNDMIIGAATKRLYINPITSEIQIKTSDGVPINYYNNTTLIMSMDVNNNVGVGKTSPTEKLDVLGNVKLSGKLIITTGTNASCGFATLVAGTVTVNTTAITASSGVKLTVQETGQYNGRIRMSAKVAGTSFTITSSDNTDTCTVYWEITN